MVDERVHKMAQVICQYSLSLQKGDFFIIQGETAVLPLIREVFREALRMGAHPEILLDATGLQEIFLKNADTEQLSYISPVQETVYREMNAFLRIGGNRNTRELSNVDPQRIRTRQQALAPLHDIFMHRISNGTLRWCGTHFPTHASAQEASMSFEEYTDFVFRACFLDQEDPVACWKELSADQERIIGYLKDRNILHFRSANADLRVSVKDRRWENSDGKRNFPSGEVFTGPVENSAEGWIRCSFPAIYAGKEVEGVELVFSAGKVIKATARKGEEHLLSLLETDEGARYLGEVAIATNYGIQQFTKNILFDEKIGGTFHIALGASYPFTGGVNRSAIHWDMICDLREDGEIAADGEVFFRNGRFLIG
jgi:aminopeptidase